MCNSFVLILDATMSTAPFMSRSNCLRPKTRTMRETHCCERRWSSPPMADNFISNALRKRLCASLQLASPPSNASVRSSAAPPCTPSWRGGMRPKSSKPTISGHCPRPAAARRATLRLRFRAPGASGSGGCAAAALPLLRCAQRLEGASCASQSQRWSTSSGPGKSATSVARAAEATATACLSRRRVKRPRGPCCRRSSGKNSRESRCRAMMLKAPNSSSNLHMSLAQPLQAKTRSSSTSSLPQSVA
mmetsp:Transcript_29647/g.82767  ORF Transcript_29647/g.82767 Transcript_29647/m.82767 type:complete len:247 (+) Transcript_29647:524-1264(+)